MRILFVLSGNSRETDPAAGTEQVPLKNPVHQGETLMELGNEVDFYFIRGKGLAGYLRNIPHIRKKVRKGGYDLVHAHYSLTAFAVSLAGRFRIVVSLAGSDVLGMPGLLPLTRFFCRYRWKKVIVKTEAMKERLRAGDVTVVPNGVDTGLFFPSDRSEARKQLGLPDKRIVLFVADPSRAEKNITLAHEAVGLLGRDDVILLPVHGVSHSRMPLYYNAADALLLTSLWEGSVNAVKEAMACNLAVVSTDVGDVRANVSGLAGYHITSYKAAEIAGKLALVLDSSVKINARERLFDLGLDSASVAGRLIEIYKSVNS